MVRDGASRLLTMRIDHLRMILSENRSPLFGIMRYAPIAIFGSASAFAFISRKARRYSTGITLREMKEIGRAHV